MMRSRGVTAVPDVSFEGACSPVETRDPPPHAHLCEKFPKHV